MKRKFCTFLPYATNIFDRRIDRVTNGNGYTWHVSMHNNR